MSNKKLYIIASFILIINTVIYSEELVGLLQKIEELTLYILLQNEKILQQEIRIKALEEK